MIFKPLAIGYPVHLQTIDPSDWLHNVDLHVDSFSSIPEARKKDQNRWKERDYLFIISEIVIWVRVLGGTVV